MDDIKKPMILQIVEHARDDWGIEIPEYGNGYARGEMPIQDNMKNPWGFVYGGSIYNLADIISSVAVGGLGKELLTVSGNMDFMRAADRGDKLICEARVAKCGRQLGFVKADIYDVEGRLLAQATFVFDRIG